MSGYSGILTPWYISMFLVVTAKTSTLFEIDPWCLEVNKQRRALIAGASDVIISPSLIPHRGRWDKNPTLSRKRRVCMWSSSLKVRWDINAVEVRDASRMSHKPHLRHVPAVGVVVWYTIRGAICWWFVSPGTQTHAACQNLPPAASSLGSRTRGHTNDFILKVKHLQVHLQILLYFYSPDV